MPLARGGKRTEGNRFGHTIQMVEKQAYLLGVWFLVQGVTRWENIFFLCSEFFKS